MGYLQKIPCHFNKINKNNNKFKISKNTILRIQKINKTNKINKIHINNKIWIILIFINKMSYNKLRRNKSIFC
jgi:hypothetical protein